MQNIVIIGVVAVLIIGGVFIMNKEDAVPEATSTTTVSETQAEQTQQSERMVVTDGSYEVVAENSTVGWAGKKPLLEGYINSGSLGVTNGVINVAGQSATGVFTINMDTLSVSETPTKPGQESKLEEHLKGERWFNVAEFPEASFEIVEVIPRDDSTTTFVYDIRGNLTMKGQTHELTFPANIYLDTEGTLHAEAAFEFDRTQWGITSGSGSFFDNLADNVVDDMVALSFDVTAIKQ